MAAVNALDELLGGASRVRVTKGGEVIADLTDPAALRELREALVVERVTDGACMCLGDLGFAFVGPGGERLAVIGFHYAASVRWPGWEGDAQLRDGARMLRWLAAYGIEGPPGRDEERAREKLARDGWLAAAPPAVRDLLDLAVAAASGNGVLPRGVSQLVRQRLIEAVPDPAERTAALLVWYGAGTGRYSGFPIYEALPEYALTETPIGELVAALRAHPGDPRVDAGALRHLCGWKSRKNLTRDVARIPPDLRERLRATSRGGDPDLHRRAERLLRAATAGRKPAPVAPREW
ncbi:hypothetical protein Asp14428_21790 [Actinoplanes sp. NBRC 14428]|nr:hypothetical protein Asp14428_21790 [Actinoplanes sp. NBRC 14428]